MPVGLDVEAVNGGRGIEAMVEAIATFYGVGVGVGHGLVILNRMFDSA
jgi:hypothetical protein